MALLTSYTPISITGGGTISLPLAAEFNFVTLTGALSMAGNCSIQADGSPVQGNAFFFQFQNRIDLNGFTLSILGKTIPNGIKANTSVFAYYNGSAWNVTIIPSFAESNIITNFNIAADAAIALTKLASVAAGRVVLGNASNEATATALTGDISIDSAGVTTIANLAVTAAKLAANAVTTAKILDGAVTTAKLSSDLQSAISQNNTLYSFSVTIPSADVLTANASPVVLVACPAGKTIQPVLLAGAIDYNSVAYATNGISYIIADGATKPLGTLPANSLLFSTVSKQGIPFRNDATIGVSDTQYLQDADLLFTVPVGNPTAGDSDINIFGLYRLV